MHIILNTVVLCTKMTKVTKYRKDGVKKMKKVKFKKTTAMFLTLAMSFGLLAGCGGADEKESLQKESSQKEEQTQDNSVAESSQAEKGTGWEEVSAKVDIPEIIKKDAEHLSWMDTTDPVTLSVYYPRRVGDSEAWGDTAIQQKITELTGVTVDGTVPRESGSNELTLLIASGDPLPDIINGISLTSTQYIDLAESDSLYDLKELIEEYCPEMWDTMDPYIRDSAIDEDGHMYYLPMQAYSSTIQKYMIGNGWFAVRGDVCEHFGIDPESITTLADIEELMELYMENKELWPEIKYPIFFPALNGQLSGRPFYNIFGGMLNYMETGLDMLYDQETDSVHYWIEDEYGYQSLKYAWSLAQKGYVTEASYGGSLVDEVYAGSVLIACGTNMWFAEPANSELADTVEGAYYQRITMVSAEEGQDVGVSYSGYSEGIGCGVVITKDCTDPERAIKFLQFMDSEYANLLVTAGVYGEDWVEEVDEYGITCIKPIGEAQTAEGRAARGVYNYDPDWFNTNSSYDYAYAYSTGAEIMKVVPKEDYVYDTYSAAPFSVMMSEPSNSDNALLRGRIEEILENYQTQMILAEDEAAFDQLYQECLDVVRQNGLGDLKEYVLGLTKKYIADMETVGVEFQ